MPVPNGMADKAAHCYPLRQVVAATSDAKEEAVSRFRRLSHTLWHCQYHVVWVPKYRYRILTGSVRQATKMGCRRSAGMPDASGGAECATGSRAPGFDNSAEGSRIRVTGSVEGADVDKDVPPVSAFEEEALLGQSFLVQGLLCGHGGIRCGHDTQVCPLSGEEGTAVRATAIVRLRIIKAAQLQGPPPLGAGPCPPMGGFFKAAPMGADLLLLTLL